MTQYVMAVDAEEDHDCSVRGCREFGCATISFLLAKIKLRHNLALRRAFTAGAPPMSALETLTILLPYDANYDQYRIEMQPSSPTLHNIMTSLGSPANRAAVTSQFTDNLPLYRRVLFHAYGLNEGGAPPYGAALFPAAPHRAMTPVCWNANVILNFDRAERRLHVRAIEPIANFTAWTNLRYDYWSGNFLMGSRTKRLQLFRLLHFRHCRCGQCSDEKEGEMNALRCSTQGCSQRIPSDQRASQPCPQCGAVVADRLALLREFMERHQELESEVPTGKATDDEVRLLKELDAACILQPDAHFRLVCGWRVAGRYAEEGRCAEAWALLQDFAVCARAWFPRYHHQRMAVVLRAAMMLFQWAAHEQHPLRSDLALGKGFLEEARDIGWILNGRQAGPTTQHLDGFLKNWPVLLYAVDNG
ncbi:uncharacterized protein LOC129596618 [Paramacrobiotus metropolitanus]|uniref:uncharacterized protein LOC129596618 n=1 Tax=Paramacrobiotus metropolitanus TaxID=2943436 RepID=UPI00244570DD|nr:uncharacterized protein LOC129596618 [Paramacrobiotus metropolitanus]XP_055349924.1 uncharacterized protein LOC129596618 [Paramacrobiotus metropolitanus]XP_055349925.1 uncharacterized protein LOC129596618 [Paramacrobiotus metropolitanus]